MITVVTPALPERAHMLAEAIESVRQQTLQPATHLIGMDIHRRGPGPTLNQLISAVDTEWVSILADDDLYDPDHLETLDKHSKDADIVLSWSRFEGSDEPQYRGKFSTLALARREDTGMRGTFMFRKSMWAELGGWPEGPMDDWRFMVDAATSHYRFVPVYRETWTYRRHDKSLSACVAALNRGEIPEDTFHLGRFV